jgi:hypothetical protein
VRADHLDMTKLPQPEQRVVLERSVSLCGGEFESVAYTPADLIAAIGSAELKPANGNVKLVAGDSGSDALTVTVSSWRHDTPCAASEAEADIVQIIDDLQKPLEALRAARLQVGAPAHGSRHSSAPTLEEIRGELAARSRPVNPAAELLEGLAAAETRDRLALSRTRHQELLQRARRRAEAPGAPRRRAHGRLPWPEGLPALPPATFAIFVLLAAIAWAVRLTTISAITFGAVALVVVVATVVHAIGRGTGAWWGVVLLVISDGFLLFAGLYLVCVAVDPSTIHVPKRGWTGEVFLLSLTLGHAGGTLDVVLTGAARIVAMAQTLLALGGSVTIALLIGRAAKKAMHPHEAPSERRPDKADQHGLRDGEKPCPLCGG